MINGEEVFGTITGFSFDKGSLSAPAFMNVTIDSEEDGQLGLFAQGKLAKHLHGRLKFGLRTTVTLHDRLILTCELYGE